MKPIMKDIKANKTKAIMKGIKVNPEARKLYFHKSKIVLEDDQDDQFFFDKKTTWEIKFFLI